MLGIRCPAVCAGCVSSTWLGVATPVNATLFDVLSIAADGGTLR